MSNSGDGSIAVNHYLQTADMIDMVDGMTNTLAFAEVKAYQPYVRNSSSPTSLNDPAPSSPLGVSAIASSGSFRGAIGHTEWTDSRGHQSGFIVTLPPNTVAPSRTAEWSMTSIC